MLYVSRIVCNSLTIPPTLPSVPVSHFCGYLFSLLAMPKQLYTHTQYKKFQSRPTMILDDMKRRAGTQKKARGNRLNSLCVGFVVFAATPATASCAGSTTLLLFSSIGDAKMLLNAYSICYYRRRLINKRSGREWAVAVRCGAFSICITT